MPPVPVAAPLLDVLEVFEVVLLEAVLFDAVLFDAVLFDAVLFDAVLFDAVLLEAGGESSDVWASAESVQMHTPASASPNAQDRERS
ncbi:MAG TPA: hypothetical protein VGZ22_01260 [Isosphaeraceae bacterium]|nr:hypothetical protein [Isosphaeraceae bacterium]